MFNVFSINENISTVLADLEDVFLGATVQNASSNTFTLINNGYELNIHGSNLTYSIIDGNTFVTGGTINLLGLQDPNGEYIFAPSGPSPVIASDFNSALQAEISRSDTSALENMFFDQDVSIFMGPNLTVVDAEQLDDGGQPYAFSGNDLISVDISIPIITPNDHYINAGAGNDHIGSTSGDDTLLGGDGNDYIGSTGGNNKMYGGNGDDRIFIIDSGVADDRNKLFGGTGNDTITGGDGKDRIKGQRHDDTLSGGDNNDRLYGGGGRDSLFGDSGNDRLYGGAGKDTIDGGAGDDALFGGGGGDNFVFASGDDTDTLWDFDTSADTLTINGFEIFSDGIFDAETLGDGTEVTVLIYGADASSGLAGGYLITYGAGDIIYIEADLPII